MAQITLARAVEVLQDFNLLLSPTPEALNDTQSIFDHMAYASNEVTASTLLVCKGAFKDAYMRDAASRGLQWYVADHEFDSHIAGQAQALVVSNTRQALAVLAQEFYDHPERQLFTVGITGTKGKSTTAYFTHAIFNDYFTHKTALISSVDNCTDGVTYVESDLTTPESLDLYRMLREAVDNGLTHAVIEVSSQAYKVDRVFNLHFNVGAFINIFPDHISPLEHPSFEDYFACKRQIIRHSDAMVLGAGIEHREEIDATITDAQVPAYFVDASSIARDRIVLDMPGDFNYDNVAIAVKIAELAGVPSDSSSLEAANHVSISGRMEVFHGSHTDNKNVVAIVDYAHNGISLTTLLDYVDSTYSSHNPHITVVTGSAGDKAVNRRVDMVQAAQHRIDYFIFTAEDTNTELVEDICAQMDAAVSDERVQHEIILDRTQAVETALHNAAQQPRLAVVLVIGKGDERWIKLHNKHVPYEGDDAIVQRVLN
ncbi:UDP-N-acetylmuramoyl-L-alanyl-D-glutamate--2,6-diaminopimelate ligase [Alloscardovia omnicolens]|uniref:UDP-N-acetylmuramoyl-L-alanyl-D-glutamate--2, 6-diaminopimelate ligase n=1 Tax=Alloscardovia omnicolens TaxID=419015 RepID=UPI003A72F2CF